MYRLGHGSSNGRAFGMDLKVDGSILWVETLCHKIFHIFLTSVRGQLMLLSTTLINQIRHIVVPVVAIPGVTDTGTIYKFTQWGFRYRANYYRHNICVKTGTLPVSITHTIQLLNWQYFAGIKVEIYSCAYYVPRTHDVIGDVTISQS